MVPELYLLAAFISEAVGTVAGFGASTLFMPLSLLFFDFRTALALVAMFHMFGNMVRLWYFHKAMDRKLAFNFGVPSVLFAAAGAYVVSHAAIPQDALKFILGLFLMTYAVTSVLKPSFGIVRTKGSELAGGAASGFLAGLIGTGGAIRGALISSFHRDKEKYVATTAAISLATDFARIPVYLEAGILHPDLYVAVPLLFGIAVGGSFAGRAILNRLTQRTFRKVLFGAVFIAGAKLCIDGLAAMLLL